MGDARPPDSPKVKLDQHTGGEQPPPPVEGGPPPSPCQPYLEADQHSCAGGHICPTGLQSAQLGTSPCSCHVPCDPDQGKMCPPAECKRVCVQLTDAQGNPIPKMGVCVADPGNAQGEPCSPSCLMGLTCVAFDAKTSFCREECKQPTDCVGYKMVCVPLQSPKINVCIPGGATVGPKEGESCAGENDFCVQGLFCDPPSKTCVTACDPQQGGCTTPKSCKTVVDTNTQVTIGYGCL